MKKKIESESLLWEVPKPQTAKIWLHPCSCQCGVFRAGWQHRAREACALLRTQSLAADRPFLGLPSSFIASSRQIQASLEVVLLSLKKRTAWYHLCVQFPMQIWLFLCLNICERKRGKDGGYITQYCPEYACQVYIMNLLLCIEKIYGQLIYDKGHQFSIYGSDIKLYSKSKFNWK